MITINKNLKSLDQFIDEQYGKEGTQKCNTFDKGYEEFKLGALLQQARLNKGMTLPRNVVQTKAIFREWKIISKTSEFQRLGKLLKSGLVDI